MLDDEDDNGHSNNVVNKCRSLKHGHEFSYVMIHRPHVELDGENQNCPPQECPLEGKSETGNSEYLIHQNCPP